MVFFYSFLLYLLPKLFTCSVVRKVSERFDLKMNNDYLFIFVIFWVLSEATIPIFFLNIEN